MSDRADLPEFRMPACWRHFFKGHKWWCRACDRETEDQFREVCEAYWPMKLDALDATMTRLKGKRRHAS